MPTGRYRGCVWSARCLVWGTGGLSVVHMCEMMGYGLPGLVLSQCRLELLLMSRTDGLQADLEPRGVIFSKNRDKQGQAELRTR